MPGFDRSTVAGAEAAVEQALRPGLGTRIRRVSGRYAAALAERGPIGGTAFVAADLGRKVGRRIPAIRRASEAFAAARADVRAPGKAAVPLLGLRTCGGIGDYVVMARYLRDLAAAAGPFEYDLYANNAAAAAWAFSAAPGLSRIRSDRAFDGAAAAYPVAAVIGQMLEVRRAADGRRGAGPKLRDALVAASASAVGFGDMIEAHPFRDGDFADAAVARGWSRRTLLQATAGVPYGGDALPLPNDPGCLERFGLLPKSYVTVHNGYDAGFSVAGESATKCYPHFAGVVAGLKLAFPGLRVVQLGTSATSRPIQGVDLDLVSRTGLKEAAAVLAGAALHLDNEGGLVHVAACYGVRSAVVFGPTSVGYFGYPDNVNLAPTFCGNCWWATPSWMEECPAGHARPRCMTDRDPQAVAAAIAKAASGELACAARIRRERKAS